MRRRGVRAKHELGENLPGLQTADTSRAYFCRKT